MVTLVFVYARWGASELLSYVDGQLVSVSEMAWLVSPTEVLSPSPSPSPFSFLPLLCSPSRVHSRSLNNSFSFAVLRPLSCAFA